MDEEAPEVNIDVFESLPLLGVCYGAQLLAKNMGGEVAKSEHREYGGAKQIYRDLSQI